MTTFSASSAGSFFWKRLPAAGNMSSSTGSGRREGGEQCKDHLIYMLAHENRKLRATAALRCVEVEVPGISPYLIAAFHQRGSATPQDIQVRYLSLDALVRTDGRAAQQCVMEGLGDESYRVRCHAVSAVGELRLTSALPRVTSLLRSASPKNREDRLVVTSAFSALSKLTGKSPPDHIRSLEAKRAWWLQKTSSSTGAPEE